MNFNFIDALKEIASGRPEFVTKEDFLARLDECSKCTELSKLTKQCKACGCFIHAKARFKHSGCPLNKWRRNE